MTASLGAESRRERAFVAGSAYLTPGELRKLDGWVVSGSICPADRVEVAAGGPPGLAEQRAAAISRELLRYGIVSQNTTNLGLMVASPADLVSGRPFTGIDGQPAVNAAQRYLNDRVKPTPTASPFAGAGGGDAGGSAPGGATGTAARDAGATKPVLPPRVSDQLI